MSNPSLQGVIFCMIVTRAHKAAIESSNQSYQRTGGVPNVGGAMPMRPVAIKITTQSQMDGENSDSTDRKSSDLTPPPSPRYLRSSRTLDGHRSPV
ncbi:hypothetical protein CPB83DRAFT_128372 [Crepidotus variabilis]|uniref:Uncharacterized protein n=1 Tax=Crepidotus variabilis TaxID=179855 RepID=A0A9P6JSC9_9AGAR|nr:hypothetical protein CPB83DRAFT_128372 [Crepidotus variabilis]